jgi:hypothetical protein
VIIDLVFIFAGFLAGLAYANERYYSKQHKTFEQLDEAVRKENAFLKNLNKSLKDDVTYLRNKIDANKR